MINKANDEHNNSDLADDTTEVDIIAHIEIKDVEENQTIVSQRG